MIFAPSDWNGISTVTQRQWPNRIRREYANRNDALRDSKLLNQLTSSRANSFLIIYTFVSVTETYTVHNLIYRRPPQMQLPSFLRNR